MTHPYSLYIWHAKHGVRGEPSWYEALQAFTQDDALYTANLIHIDSKAVIKVVRYGLNLACTPSEHTVELCERQIARQKQPHERKTDDFEPETTFMDENDFSVCLSRLLALFTLVIRRLHINIEAAKPKFYP